MIAKNLAAWAMFPICAVFLVSCSSSEQLAENIATSDDAMWYRFTFEGEYQGKPFKIDQMVNCTMKVESGGFLGQSPNTVISEGRPLSAAARMADGSQILVRIPNMCKRYRKFERAFPYDPKSYNNDGEYVGDWSYRPGWKSRGPHPVIPLVLWSDKMPSPDRIEAYVARDYYTHPKARVKNPRGFVDLWPVGQYPQNYREVLKQNETLARYPNPTNRGSKSADGDWHGVGDSYAAYSVTPVINSNEFVDKYGTLSLERPNKDQKPIQNKLFIQEINDYTAKRSKPNVAFEHPRFRAYHMVGDNSDNFHALSEEPSFITSKCVQEALAGLALGRPGMSNLPYDAADFGSSYPDQVRMNIASGRLQHVKDRMVNANARLHNCYAQLGKLRTFEIINGRLDASEAIPGVIVYRKWNGRYLGQKRFAFSQSFLDSGVVDPASNVFRLRIDGTNVNYPLEGPTRHERGYPIILEDKQTGQWLQILIFGNTFFIGDGEVDSY